ncbi:Predicted gene 5431 [Apodemus speciosus]|uniref:Predicted gene 5431 n=1 Tax=Apodemus speciosus TaxID=105296 RepID=A0ABQ0F9R5_APOSI
MGADKGGAAASTGVEFTTTERTPHAYTKFPSVTLWDLPGIGSTGFQSHDYLKKIKVEEYDFFIIVFSRCLKYNDTELVKAIVQTNRSFYYVQTKIDLDLMVEKQCKPRIFNKENILEQIRNNISNIVKEVTHQEPPVFLVSNFDVSDFDFPKLESTLLSELPAYKHHIFMLTLPSVIDATIDQKKNMLKRKLWKVSTMLSILANKEFRELTHNNMEMLERTLNDCRSSFGLDKASLRNIAEDLNVTLEELRANIKSPHLFSDEPDTSFTDKLLKHIRHSNFSNVSQLQNNFIDILASDVKIILSEEVLLKEKYHLHFLGMGQTSSSTTPPKEYPDLTSNFGKNLQNFKMKTKILSQELIAFIESSLEHGNLRETVSAISKSLGDIEKTPLNIAVMGESGTGKSSLISALRGAGVDEEGAAATGVICTTTERTPYSCAKFPSVTLWDLPGIVSFDFQSHDYLKKIKFEEYDLFIIVSCRRLTQNVTELVKAIVKMNRSFYFVQTNIDLDLMNEEKCKPKTFDKENTLKKILNPISRALKEVTQQEPPVFLVSNFDVSDFDFPKLEATLLSKLPVYKRHKFMHALQIVTDSTIDQKRDMLKQKIWKESIMPRAWATIPFRRLNQNDIEMLEQTLNDYRSSFGLDEASLGNIAKDLNMTLEELKENIESPHLLSDEPDTALTEKLMKYIRNPYFSKIVHLQNYFVDTVASDVKIILSKEELLTEKHPPLHRAICKPSSSTPSSLTVQLLAFGFENFLKNFEKESSILSKETITLIESHLEGENLQGALSTITHALRKIDKAPLNIAVTGETGTGKSSFINALRGVRVKKKVQPRLGW